jgi:hypothetical protein
MPKLSDILGLPAARQYQSLAEVMQMPAAPPQLTLADILDPRAMAAGMGTAPSAGGAEIGANFLPGIGDVIGVAQDANMYWQDPSSRTPFNYAMSGLGLLPFVPAAAAGSNKLLDVAKQAIRPDDMPRVKFPDLEGPKELKRAKTAKEAAKFPGAPAHVASREAEQAVIDNYLSLVEYGAPAGNWYKDEARRILAMSGYRPGVADRATGSLAITSANTALEPNVMGGIRGFNQGMAGHEVKTHMPDNNAKIQQIFDGLIERMGPKINPYHKHLQSAYEPKGGRAVHDIWDMRAWSFGEKDTPGIAQHRWMDAATEEAIQLANARKLGGRSDWDVDSIQAAAWTALKAQELKVPPSELANGYRPFLDRNTANLSVESMPSKELTNPIAGMDPLSQDAFHRAQESIFTTPDRQDLVAQQVGLLTPPSGKYIGQGAYEGVSNPVTRIPMLSGIDNSANQAMDPASRELIEATGATHGLLRGQASVGYDFIRRPNSLTKGASNALTATYANPLTGQDMLGAQSRLDEVFGAGSTAVTPAPNGLNALYFGADNAGFQKQAGQIFPGAAPGKNSGDLIGADAYKPSAYMAKINQNPLARARIDAIAPKLASEMKRLIGATGGQWDQKMTLVLDALESGGLAAVDDLVKKGLVPAAILGVASRLLQEDGTPAQGTPATA